MMKCRLCLALVLTMLSHAVLLGVAWSEDTPSWSSVHVAKLGQERAQARPNARDNDPRNSDAGDTNAGARVDGNDAVAEVDDVAACYLSCSAMVEGVQVLVDPDLIESHLGRIAAMQERCGALFSLLDDDAQLRAVAVAGEAYGSCRRCSDRCDEMVHVVSYACSRLGLGGFCDVARDALRTQCAAAGCSPLVQVCEDGCAEMAEEFFDFCDQSLPSELTWAAGRSLVARECVTTLCAPSCDVRCAMARAEAEAECWVEPPAGALAAFSAQCAQTASYDFATCTSSCCAPACDDALRAYVMGCNGDATCILAARRERDVCASSCSPPPPSPECGNGICEGQEYEHCQGDCYASASCGDAICDSNEEFACPRDCFQLSEACGPEGCRALR